MTQTMTAAEKTTKVDADTKQDAPQFRDADDFRTTRVMTHRQALKAMRRG